MFQCALTVFQYALELHLIIAKLKFILFIFNIEVIFCTRPVHDPTSFQLLYISSINKGNLTTYLPTATPQANPATVKADEIEQLILQDRSDNRYTTSKPGHSESGRYHNCFKKRISAALL